jgi:hypothetical protein
MAIPDRQGGRLRLGVFWVHPGARRGEYVRFLLFFWAKKAVLARNSAISKKIWKILKKKRRFCAFRASYLW